MGENRFEENLRGVENKAMYEENVGSMDVDTQYQEPGCYSHSTCRAQNLSYKYDGDEEFRGVERSTGYEDVVANRDFGMQYQEPDCYAHPACRAQNMSYKYDHCEERIEEEGVSMKNSELPDSETCLKPITEEKRTGNSVKLIGANRTSKHNVARLRRLIRQKVKEDGPDPRVNRVNTYMEEHISNSDTYYGQVEEAKVYVLHGLSLYAKIQILNMDSYVLIDCGAGINLISTGHLRKLIMKAEGHAMMDVKIVHRRLVARVANEKIWELKKKAIISYSIEGEQFSQEFWIAEDMAEDMIFGMPALRAMAATIHIAEKAKEGADYLLLRNSGKKAFLQYYSHGITTSKVALSPLEPFTMRPGTAKVQRLKIRSEVGIAWPEGKELTGLVEPFINNDRPSAIPVLSLSKVDEDTGYTSVILRNTTDSEVTYYPGDTVATLDPMILKDCKDRAGNTYLYLGVDGQLHPKIIGEDPNQAGGYGCQQTLLPLSQHPVAIKKLTLDKNGIVTESIEPMSIEDMLEYARGEGHVPVRGVDKVEELENRMEDKVALPTGEEYSYKDVKVNPNLTVEEKKLVWDFLEKHQDSFAPIKQSYPNTKLGGFATQYITLK